MLNVAFAWLCAKWAEERIKPWIRKCSNLERRNDILERRLYDESEALEEWKTMANDLSMRISAIRATVRKIKGRK